MKRNYIILSVLLLFSIVFLLCFFNPRFITIRKLNLKLPKSAKIINYDFSPFGETHFSMKVMFNADDYETVRDRLESCGLKRFPEGSTGDLLIERLPNFRNTTTWWDMEKDEIIMAYFMVKRGKRIVTLNYYAFITKDKYEKYFLYIDC